MPASDPTAPIEALVASMTLEEKIGQMTLVLVGQAVTGPGGPVDYLHAIRAGQVGTVSDLWGPERAREVRRIALEETRLRIPLLFVLDVIHGHRTIFPLPLAEVGTFDPELWQQTARAASSEATADRLTMTYAPMLDVPRDPRWGRIAESPGEYPWLAARFAHAKILGFQGEDLAAANSLAATAKHLAAYGAVTAGREYAAVDVAFHNLAGVPMSADAAVLRNLVRGRWGFGGIIVSDYGAIAELMVHGVAEDLAEAAALALRAGIDIDLMGNAYARGLPGALERGRMTIADVDAAVRRILALKAALGLFEDPYRRGHGLASEQLGAHRALARKVAQRAIVLLTNRGGVPPLSPDGGRVVVMGPLVDACNDMLEPWATGGPLEEMVTILEGLRTAFPDREGTHAPGVQIDGGDTSGVPAALDIARKADVVVLCLGEARAMSGEAASRARPTLPDRQAELARAALEDLTFLGSDLSPCVVPGIFEIHVGPSAARDSLLETTLRLVADGTADARPSLA